jgi:type VI secretion system protein ImpJ
MRTQHESVTLSTARVQAPPRSERIAPTRMLHMRHLQPVLWSRGQLLDPQHLQAQDRYVESLLAFHLGALRAHAFGFSELRIDEDALASGRVAVLSMRGCFTDALVFDSPGSDALPPMLQLPICERGVPVTISLAIPQWRDSAPNAGAETDTTMRYRISWSSRVDENGGTAERLVPLGTRNLRLISDRELATGYDVLPVVALQSDGAGQWHRVAEFEPPQLRTGATASLRHKLTGLCDRLAARAADLSARRSQRNQSLADFSVSDVANFWLLHTINTHLPVLLHQTRDGAGHPADAFQTLATLAGALSTFAPRGIIADHIAYPHAAAGPAFAAAIARIDELAHTVVPQRAVALPMRATRPNVHATAIDDDRLLHDAVLYLAVSSGMRNAELPRRIPQLVKVADAGSMDRLIRQALPGLGLTHIPQPPDAIPIRLDFQYFRIDKGGAAWDMITMARDMAVYVPSEVETPRLELVALLP